MGFDDWLYLSLLTDPLGALDQSHRRLHRLLGEPVGTSSNVPFPPVNIWSDTDKAVVIAEVPGLSLEKLDVSVQDNVLTIRGTRESEKIEDDASYCRRERGQGSFSRSVSLGFSVDGDKVDASYKNGVLTVVLQRSEADKPKKVEVKG